MNTCKIAIIVSIFLYQSTTFSQTHSGHTRTLSDAENNALYLKELKAGKYDSDAILRWEREQHLMDAGVLTDANDMLTRADKVLMEEIKNYRYKTGSGLSAPLPGAEGVPSPRLCSASRLHAARMAEDKVVDHYGFIPQEGSPYQWKGKTFPMRKDQLLKVKFAAGKEISASEDWSQFISTENMAQRMYQKSMSALTEDEQMRVAAWTCIDGWRTRSSTGTHFRNLQSKHEYFCFSMVLIPEKKSFACNGLFIH